ISSPEKIIVDFIGDITHPPSYGKNTTIRAAVTTADRHANNHLRNIELSNARHRLANDIIYANQMVDVQRHHRRHHLS
ncbi:hypothetical protein L195_g041025, partial [Trifolium pratense]